MNAIYKVIWNHAANCYQVVSELARSVVKTSAVVATTVLALAANAAETSKEYVDENIERVERKLNSMAMALIEVNKISGLENGKADKTALALTDAEVSKLKTSQIEQDSSILSLQNLQASTTNQINSLEGNLNSASEKITSLQQAQTNQEEKIARLTEDVGKKLSTDQFIDTTRLLNSDIANKASLTELNKTKERIVALENAGYETVADAEVKYATKQELKVAQDLLKTDLESKASKTAIQVLSGTVSRKANQTSLDETNQRVATLETSQTAQDIKIKALDEGKVDKTDLENYVTIAVADNAYASKGTEATAISAKETAESAKLLAESNKTVIETANAKITTFEASQAAQETKIVVLEDTKADKTELARTNEKVIDLSHGVSNLSDKVLAAFDKVEKTKANTADLANLATKAELSSKADISSLQSLATKQSVADLTTAVNSKADTVTVNAELAKKANTSDLADLVTKQELKVAQDLLKTDLDSKASKTAIQVLSGTVSRKANQTALDETNQLVKTLEGSQTEQKNKIRALDEGKVDKTELVNYVTKTVADSSYASKLTEVTAESAKETAESAKFLSESNQTALVAASNKISELEVVQAAQRTNISELDIAKVDKTELVKTNTRVDNLSQGVSDLSDKVLAAFDKIDKSKADVAVVDQKLAAKANQSDLINATDRISSLESNKANQNELQKVVDRVQTLENTKADISVINNAVTALTETMNGKADTATVNAELANKANVSALATLASKAELAEKVDKAALEMLATKQSVENLATVVNGKADTATVNAELANKANVSALATLASKAELAEKATKVEMNLISEKADSAQQKANEAVVAATYAQQKVIEVENQVQEVSAGVISAKQQASLAEAKSVTINDKLVSAGVFDEQDQSNIVISETKTSLGKKAEATGSESMAFGGNSQATEENSTAVGFNAQAKAKNTVAIGHGSVAERENSVSVGAIGKERIIANVAAGAQDTDAVNYAQLNVTNQKVYHLERNIASNTKRVEYLEKRIEQMDKKLKAGVAGVTAMANLPQVSRQGKVMTSAAVGSYDGQSSVAIGISKMSNDGKIILKASGSANTQGSFSVGAGIGYEW